MGDISYLIDQWARHTPGAERKLAIPVLLYAMAGLLYSSWRKSTEVHMRSHSCSLTDSIRGHMSTEWNKCGLCDTRARYSV